MKKKQYEIPPTNCDIPMPDLKPPRYELDRMDEQVFRSHAKEIQMILDQDIDVILTHRKWVTLCTAAEGLIIVGRRLREAKKNVK